VAVEMVVAFARQTRASDHRTRKVSGHAHTCREKDMATMDAVNLVDLNESNLVLAHAVDDVRGLPVVDLQGHRLGTVVDLVVEEKECRARGSAARIGDI
jgi:PRC-barrel domain